MTVDDGEAAPSNCTTTAAGWRRSMNVQDVITRWFNVQLYGCSIVGEDLGLLKCEQIDFLLFVVGDCRMHQRRSMNG